MESGRTMSIKRLAASSARKTGCLIGKRFCLLAVARQP